MRKSSISHRNNFQSCSLPIAGDLSRNRHEFQAVSTLTDNLIMYCNERSCPDIVHALLINSAMASGADTSPLIPYTHKNPEPPPLKDAPKKNGPLRGHARASILPPACVSSRRSASGPKCSSCSTAMNMSTVLQRYQAAIGNASAADDYGRNITRSSDAATGE